MATKRVFDINHLGRVYRVHFDPRRDVVLKVTKRQSCYWQQIGDYSKTYNELIPKILDALTTHPERIAWMEYRSS